MRSNFSWRRWPSTSAFYSRAHSACQHEFILIKSSRWSARSRRPSAMSGHEIRLLALDGGGVRGLSSLIILQQLMETIEPDSPPKPCDYFDMIGGTSTGG